MRRPLQQIHRLADQRGLADLARPGDDLEEAAGLAQGWSSAESWGDEKICADIE